ncbi:MAG: hypothetical protein V9E99_19340 [Microthrixaceae bacterium]|jgi:hypothetical protein|nr:hypothetical protein [Actinomycetota bacterium]HMS13408.1 hypothetical protein [Microthrixaceae bacterium]HMT25148.1 hypothetical protein [Microthrixaceae bacterium]HMT60501.1 hypothetical protein [Microthrixaceae bacterium]
MNEATAYRIAGRFGDKGWLGNAWRLPDDDTERPRREYWLTEAGLSAASDADSRAGVGDGPDFAKVHSATSI